MSKSNKQIDAVAMIGLIIDHLGVPKSCQVLRTNQSDISRWRSREIDEMHENHRPSPIEKIESAINALLIEEIRDKKKSTSAREVLDILGDYIAELCGGVYIPPDVANKLGELFKRED